MSDMTNVARPYAKALFKLAKSGQTINIYYDYLRLLSAFARNDQFKNLIYNPRIDAKTLMSVILDFIDANVDQIFKKFLQLLQLNGRLQLLGDIFILFDQLVKTDNNNVDAIIETPFELSDQDKTDFEKLLSARFKCDVTAKIKINSELIGGVKILVNDVIIDGSVKNRLRKMASQVIK